MEPVGLAVGVLGLSGLFSVCLEAVARFDAWKKFDGDLAFLGLRVEAERLRLDKWGQAAGFQPNSTFGNNKDDVIKSHHHVALHDKRTADIVKKLLILLRDVCAGRDGLLFLDSTGILRSGSDLATPQNPFGISSISRRARLKWALKDKATCEARVEQIELVVQKLHDLVPPSGPLRVTDDAAAAHQQVSDDLSRVLADREDVRSAILKIEQSLNAKTRRELQSWLLGRHTPNEIFETALKRKQESTCQWILNRKDFLKWVSSDDLVAKFLWINGPAAFGKTILCSALITHLQSTLKTPVAFYFFSSDDLESRRDPFSALRLWLVQLLSNDTIFYALRGRFESSQGQAASTGDVISAFKDAVQMFPECIFVMDGLDECENGEDSCSVTDFLKTLSWVISGTRARILITSRDETAIRQGLFGTAGVAAVEYKISQKDVHPDIGKYCQAVIHEKLFGRDEKLCDDLSQKMAKRCNGQFLWIKLQGSRLSRYKSAAKLEAEIDKTPSGLDHLYDRNWGIIEKREPAARERAYAMMRWVGFAARPLTVAELTEALLVDLDCDSVPLDELPDYIEDDYIDNEIRKMSASLLEIHKSGPRTDPANHTVHFTHFSAKQYFILRTTEKMSTMVANERLRSLMEAACISELANKCLHYISMPHVWKTPEKTIHPIYRSFRDYAADAWYLHASASGHADIVQRCNRFFTQEDSVWKLWRGWYDLADTRKDEPHEVVDERPLYYAARLNLIETARYLMDSGHCDVNAKTMRFGTPILQEAVSFGNIDMAKVLLNAGADIFAQDKDGRTALHAASLMGRLELMQVFLDRGVDVNVRDSLNRTPLHEAACNSDARAVQILLKRGADRRAQDKKAKTALHVGSLAGRLDVVRSLLKQSVEPDDGNSLQSHATSEVDARAKNDWTPIHFAAAAGFADIVQVLIDFGADISATDDLGNTPSHFAAVRGQADVIRILGKHGSRFSVHNNDGYSPLDFASRQGHINVVEAILEQELSAADIDQVSGDNITSMHAACIMGHVEIVKLLLQAGADPENQHDPDSNPIIAACINGHSELVQLLLAAGADLGVTNSAKQTPLHVASLHGFTEVVYLLLEGGADPAAVDDHRFTPAFHAARGGHASMLRLQLDAGANIHATDINGNTLLHVSAPHAAVVELLVEKGLDINAVSAKGYTPLHVAAVLGHVPAVKLLLENGASLEIKDGQANNALMLAAQYGHAEVARLCIESGTDVDAVDLDGFTALAIAAGRGHATIVELLLAGGVDLRRKGAFALTGACLNGHTAIAKLLLERGVDVGGTETGGNGTTALSAASFGGHATTVALLLERGANVEPEGISEGTPLLAAALQGQVEVARLLLDHGAQVDAAIDGGYTPLSIATHAGHLTMARLLVEVGGARVDLCTVDGRTPLMVASTGGRAAIVELLLSGRRGAAADYVDARDRHGQTAFSLAVRCGARATARALRATGVVDLLSEDKYGRTPLCWARRLGYADMEEFLAADDGGAEDGKLLAYGTGDDPGPLVCHVCLLPVPEDMSFGICEVCPTFSGRFSVCHECYELGARCADQRHSLKERPTPTQSMAELHV